MTHYKAKQDDTEENVPTKENLASGFLSCRFMMAARAGTTTYYFNELEEKPKKAKRSTDYARS